MDRFKLIESYLANTLSEADRITFEQRMKTEPDLAADVDAHAKMNLSLDALLAKDVAKVIEEERTNSTKASQRIFSGSKGKFLRRRYLSLAAAILLLLVAGWWWTQPNLHTTLSNNDKLYAEYCQWPIEKNSRTDIDNPLSVAEEKFQKAITEMKNGDHKQALRDLQMIDVEDNQLLSDKVDWYTAMCYLKMGDDSRLQDYITNIVSDTRHSYYRIAKELNAEL